MTTTFHFNKPIFRGLFQFLWGVSHRYRHCSRRFLHVAFTNVQQHQNNENNKYDYSKKLHHECWSTRCVKITRQCNCTKQAPAYKITKSSQPVYTYAIVVVNNLLPRLPKNAAHQTWCQAELTCRKHGDELRSISSIAHLVVACRMFASYSRELAVPDGVPRERS